MNDEVEKVEEVVETEVQAEQESAEETVVLEEDEVSGKGDPDFAAGDTPDFKWYIAKTMTGQENKVQKTLRENILNHKMAEMFSRILVPEESVVTSVNGKKRTIKKKFFPGYVLIKMIMNDKTWHLVKNTDKITGFVGGTKDKPAPLSDEEAAKMTNQSAEGMKKPRMNVTFEEGGLCEGDRGTICFLCRNN